MPGAAVAASVARMLVGHGEAMTLRRMTAAGATPTWSDVTVYAKRFRPKSAGSDDLAGAAAQNTLSIVISNAEISAAGWPGPPRKSDRIVAAGRTYTLEADADTRWDAGVIVQHRLVAKG